MSIELTQNLKALNREAKALKEKIVSIPSTPADFVQNAGVEIRLGEIKMEQSEIGQKMLDLQAEREKVIEKHILDQSVYGVTQAKKLIEKLPGFANKLAVAFDVLGEDFEEITELSQSVDDVNNFLLRSHKRHCVNGGGISQRGLNALLDDSFRSAFHGENIDIVEAFAAAAQGVKID